MTIELTQTEIQSIQNSLQLLFNYFENGTSRMPNEILNICDKLNIEVKI